MSRWVRVGVLLALTVSLLFVASASRAEDSVTSLIAQISKVGREGVGNEQAAVAWKALVQQGPKALVPILTAIRDDAPVANNWLRPAFEAIAEKAVAEEKLAAEPLAKFVDDTMQAGSARALAYAWLVKLDKSTPDRLLPKMLQDPSAELRRLAIARVLRQAETFVENNDDVAAKATLEKLLPVVGDPEQLDTIAKGLDKFGVKIDRAKVAGFVTTWHLIAPFDHRKGIGWDVAYPPEKAIDLAATLQGKEGQPIRWIAHTTKSATGVVDLNQTLGKFKGAIAYAVAFVESPEERQVELRAGCINGLKIWLNGKLVFANEEYHHGMNVDQYKARGKLNKGVNTILLKVAQNEQTENWAQEWQFQLRICDFVGAAVPFSLVTKESK